MDINNVASDGAFTVKDFCAWARIGRTGAYQLINAGKVSAVKAGGKTLIMKASAQQWLASLPPIGKQSRAQEAG
jgi:Helix-turn-helix domain